MRKTRIKSLLTEIRGVALSGKVYSGCIPASKFNSSDVRKQILATKDRICDLCSELENEVF